MNHTPTPWKVDKYGQVLTDPSSGCYETIATTPKAWIDNKLFNQDCNADAITMLQDWSARAQANAEFVVTACNAHEELVAALHRILDGNTMAGRENWTHADVIQEHYKIARKALTTIEKRA